MAPSSQIQSGQEEPLKRVGKIVASLMARPDAAPFLEPVDWRGLELWDYPSVVKRLMDLGTIRRKLERNQYETAAQCAADVRQVWKNCMTYNKEHSDFWLLAKALSKRFEDRYRKIKAEFYVGEDELDDKDGGASSEDEEAEFDDVEPSPDAKSRSSVGSSSGGGGSGGTAASPPPQDSRTRLGAHLLQLSGVDLGRALSILERKAPFALEKSEIRDRMEINLDGLDAGVLHELSTFAAERAAAAAAARGSIHSSNGLPGTPSWSPAIDDVSNKRRRKK